MSVGLRTLVAGAACLFSAHAASAAGVKDYSLAVTDALFETCPKALEGSLSLNDAAAVGKLGFTPAPDAEEAKAAHPQFGRPEGIEKKVAGGSIALMAYPGTMCTVVFDGPDRLAARDLLFRTLEDKTSGFTRDTAPSTAPALMEPHSYKSRVEDGMVLHYTIMTAPASSPTPVVIATLSATKA